MFAYPLPSYRRPRWLACRPGPNLRCRLRHRHGHLALGPLWEPIPHGCPRSALSASAARLLRCTHVGSPPAHRSKRGSCGCRMARPSPSASARAHLTGDRVPHSTSSHPSRPSRAATPPRPFALSARPCVPIASAMVRCLQTSSAHSFVRIAPSPPPRAVFMCGVPRRLAGRAATAGWAFGRWGGSVNYLCVASRPPAPMGLGP